MNRRDFLKSSAVMAVGSPVMNIKGCSLLLDGRNRVYERSVHFMYPQLMKRHNETFVSLTNALDQVRNKVTCLSPLFLNVTDPTSGAAYQNMLSYVRSNGITFTPGVGGPGPNHRLNDNGPNEAVLQAYANVGFQPYLRVDNLNGFYQNPGGEDDIKTFLRKAIGMGFTKIMLNPWPQYGAGGKYMIINESDIFPYIDACFQNASYQDYTVVKPDIENIVVQAPGTPILINYESPGPQGTIAMMSLEDQINTFNTTLNSIQSYPIPYHLHWAPPFTGSYDPLAAGTDTWPFIADKLSRFQG